MKRSLAGLLVALSLAAAPARSAQPPPGTTEISVSGTGSVTLAPDVASVGAAIETNAANAGDAVARNNVLYDRVVQALMTLGIARDDVTLAYYNVNDNPRPQVRPPHADGQRYGFTVSRGFAVKVRDIAKAGSVADACTRSGATSIDGVTFGLANPSAARASATQKAVDDARAAAQTLATAAHLRIVSIESIDLGGRDMFAPQPLMRAAASGAAPTQFDQSNVSVTVSVTVTFLAEP